MRLMTLKASNLFSLGEVEIDLDRKGLVLVTGRSVDEGGSNGSGKSNLANKAIVWGLFGETAGSLRADEVCNRHAPKKSKAEVSILFEGHDGQTYEVVRTRHPNGLELYAGRDRASRLTHKVGRETQQRINDLLGRDITSFLQTDFFGQGRLKSYPALSPKEQKAVLEQILPISVLQLWADRSNDHKKEVLESLLEWKDKKNVGSGRKDTISQHLQDLEQQRDEWDATLKGRISEYEHTIVRSADTIKAFEKEKEEVDKSLIAMGDQAKERAEAQTAERRLKGAEEETTKASEVVNQWRNHITYLEGKARPIVENKCPTCDQVLPQDKSIQLRKEQEELHAEIVNARNVMKVALEAYDGRKIMNDAFRREQKEAFDRISSTIDLMKKGHDLLGKIQSIDIAGTQALLDQARLEKNPHTVPVEALKKEQTSVLQDLETYNEMIMKIGNEVNILSFWYDAFNKDMKNYLLAKACPFLNERTKRHLEALGNDQLHVSFSTVKLLKGGDTREDFNVQVESTSGGKGYLSLSGGEQQIVSFAVGLALSDLAETQAEGASHFLILDEPFTELDDRNNENLVSYLTTDLGSKRETILLISNDDKLKSLVPSVLGVVKEKGISRLENGDATV